jgi:hypothetical protein
LALVDADAGGLEAAPEMLVLQPQPQVSEFAAAAAAAGLELEEAAALALERTLALSDATLFGLDRETARRMLRRAAMSAQAHAALSDADAAHVRRLSAGQRLPLPVSMPPTVAVPERLLRRAAAYVKENPLRAAAVPEMVRWEIAARLEGRTLLEWALKTLGATAVRGAA